MKPTSSSAPFTLLAAALLLLAACAPAAPGSEAASAAFDRFYGKVPREQRERLLAFRAAHPEKRISAGGVEWRYIACGEGERTLLLLPGVSRLAETQFVLISLLEQHYRIIAPSYAPVATIAELADGLAGILDAEGVEQADVYGASFGGMIAQRFVRRHPARVRRLILANTGITNVPKIVQGLLGVTRWLPGSLVRAAMRQMAAGVRSAPAEEKAFWEAYYSELYTARITREDAVSFFANGADFSRTYDFATTDLAGWPGRILILESDHDEAFKPEERAALRALYPQATVHTFANAGHEPWMTHQAEFLAELDGFLAAEP